MMKQGLVAICLLNLLAGCGFFGGDPKPPQPTIVIVEVEADGDINLSASGNASPLVLRIYQLTSRSRFEDGDFMALFENDAEVLGKHLIEKKEITLRPNTKDSVTLLDLSEDVEAIGFMGVFREEGANWRAVEEIEPNQTTVIRVYVSGNALTSRLKVGQGNPD